MNLDIKNLGERIQMLRKAMNLSQKDLGTALGVSANVIQTKISRLENGDGVSTEFLLQLINYFNDHFHVQYLFAENFEVVKKSDPISQQENPYFNIALERLKAVKKDVIEIVEIMEKEAEV